MGRFLSSRLFHYVRDGCVTSSPVRGGQRIQECAASLFFPCYPGAHFDPVLVILGRGAPALSVIPGLDPGIQVIKPVAQRPISHSLDRHSRVAPSR